MGNLPKITKNIRMVHQFNAVVIENRRENEQHDEEPSPATKNITMRFSDDRKPEQGCKMTQKKMWSRMGNGRAITNARIKYLKLNQN
jgi:hypothetical protein